MRHADHDPALICRPAGYGLCEPLQVIECDVCGLPDLYGGQGDGIGSCDCPRCDGGEAAESSVLCICPPDEDPF